jgi:hypothetical protein
MEQSELNQIFTKDYLNTLLPVETSDQFFEALYGDADEGAYDIGLEYISRKGSTIALEFNLTKRPGKCLVCSLTYGLPTVFSRHPLINLNGMVEKIKGEGLNIKSWSLGNTEEKTSDLHTIPFYLELE